MQLKPPGPSGLWEPIRKGFVAERRFVKTYFDEANKLARNTYKIPDNQLDSLSKRALKAAVQTIRFHEWMPGLIRRMVQSQAAVLRWQQDKITTEDVRKIKGVIERFVRNHLGQRIGGQLNLSQEIVCGETFDIFAQKLKKPGFTLTSGIDTYLIGIAINQIKSFGRRQQRSTAVSTDTRSDDQPDLLLLEKIRFYRIAHRLVAQQLSQLDDKCLAIILQHYGIDPGRVDAVSDGSESVEPLTDAEFDALFSVASGTATESRKLKDIAIELGISPKKISEKHLDCLDRLVQQVVPMLLEESDSAFVDTVREEMKNRLSEAQVRKQKKKSEKQRYADSRRS